MSESRLERGKRIRAQVLGNAKRDASAGPAMPEAFVELGLEFAWGTVWAGEELPVKTRRLVTIALLAAQGRARELAMHLRAALHADCTPAELRALCTHVTLYCGFPAAAEALRALEEAVAGT